jgi:hypothetical protein
MELWQRANRVTLPLWATYALILLGCWFVLLPLIVLLDGSPWFFYPFALISSLLGGWLISTKMYRMTILEKTSRSSLVRLDRLWPNDASMLLAHPLESGHSTPGGTMTETPADPNATPVTDGEAAATPAVESTAEPAPAPAVTAPPEAMPAPEPATTLQQTADQRKAGLDAALARFGAGGWRIETRSDFQATIVKGHRTNHVLHLILTIVTLGIWAIVWILMVLFGGEKREMVTVDPYGNIVSTKV